MGVPSWVPQRDSESRASQSTSVCNDVKEMVIQTHKDLERFRVKCDGHDVFVRENPLTFYI
jgi:hypothetical protein